MTEPSNQSQPPGVQLTDTGITAEELLARSNYQRTVEKYNEYQQLQQANWNTTSNSEMTPEEMLAHLDLSTAIQLYNEVGDTIGVAMAVRDRDERIDKKAYFLEDKTLIVTFDSETRNVVHVLNLTESDPTLRNPEFEEVQTGEGGGGGSGTDYDPSYPQGCSGQLIITYYSCNGTCDWGTGPQFGGNHSYEWGNAEQCPFLNNDPACIGSPPDVVYTCITSSNDNDNNGYGGGVNSPGAGGGLPENIECAQDISSPPWDLDGNCQMSPQEAYLLCRSQENCNAWEHCENFGVECYLDDLLAHDCYVNDECLELLCNEIHNQLNNEAFQEKENELRNSYGLQHEVGHIENGDGSFTEMTPVQRPDGGHSVTMNVGSGIINVIGLLHTHVNDYQIPDENGDGVPETRITLKMPSVQDLFTFLYLVQNTSTNNFDMHEVYTSMYSSAGDYTLKFTGDWNDIFNNLQNLQLQKEDLDEKYKKYFKKYKSNKEKALLKFIENEIGIDGIDLFKINSDGTIINKQLNNNGDVESTDCEE